MNLGIDDIVPEALHKKVGWDMRHHMAEKVVDRFWLKLPRDRELVRQLVVVYVLGGVKVSWNKAAHSRSVTSLPHLFLSEVKDLSPKGRAVCVPRARYRASPGSARTGASAREESNDDESKAWQ
jgi:hypothetical protein